MNLERRDFLKLAGLVSTSLFIPWDKKILANTLSESQHLVSADGTTVSIENLITHDIKKYPTRTKGHDFYQHTGNKNLIYVVSKWENQFSILDLASGKDIEQVNTLDKDFIFYGHIAFNAEGTRFYSPQISASKNIGTVVVYDARTNKPIDQIGSIEGGTHDVQFLSDQKTLVVTSDGVKNKSERIAPSSLLLLDVESKKQIYKFHLENAYQKVAHLRILSNDEIVVITSPLDIPREGKIEKHGLVYSNRGVLTDPVLTEWKIPSKIADKVNFELLSSAFNQSTHQLLVTNPQGNLILYFDTKTKKFIKSEANGDPGVVTYKNKFLTVKTNAHAKIIDLA